MSNPFINFWNNIWNNPGTSLPGIASLICGYLASTGSLDAAHATTYIGLASGLGHLLASDAPVINTGTTPAAPQAQIAATQAKPSV